MPATKIIELRAHHLYTLLSYQRLPKFLKPFAKFSKNLKLTLCGYKNGNQFSTHLIQTMDDLLTEKIKNVRITSTRDFLCQQCHQKREKYCQVAGLKWSLLFLKKLDQTIAQNSNGFLEIGKIYPTKKIIKNYSLIKKAILKTIWQLPSLIINLKSKN
ncbi:MAG: hypothetical protein UT55_C0025G0002 [Candidatus Peregrinibacteria bacterium GW2011_GWE2_39_6]|nr:MAG: hypothetical protein UT36_C0012G0024 [Candidatus Peregrinibacteria bacterium GW2011_GWF2_39_17]KKR25905.1 MAG: hypothetical protein UT55_C0025G0002 [Candidatus Peregrinibacteria bacterium GW2011_GWE2_39_6]